MPTSAEILARRFRGAGEQSDHVSGLLTFTCAVALFAVVDTSAKWLILAGLPALMVAFVRYFGALVMIVAVALPRDGLGAFRSVNPKLQLLRSICLMFSTVLNFIALTYLPLSTVVSIMFAGPVMTTLLAVPLLGEKITARRMAAVLLGFSGVLVVMQPWGDGFQPAMLISVCAMTATSLYFILTRRLANEAQVTQQLWSTSVASLVLLPVALTQWSWPHDAVEWSVLLFIGPVALAAHTLVVRAHRLAAASVLAPVIYLQLIFVSITGYLIFGAVPGLSVIVGGGIIIAAGLWLRQIDRAAVSRRV
ncbi:DMT family transporter [Paracoccus tegillarcae]|uniref:EamA/RhaT family transporter n=1 Tax=Paracoccus tegillarcae TaxID=1529068 RepID=A0A2K9EGN0_9RHOB|nr:DMT family transporter [Paracoccus tegillarcae]AUH33499.1 EamA/RhaT family transporter [Paracoccus tegillarcae]